MLNLTENALTVLQARYLKREKGKVIETPEDLFRRVAKNVASAEPSQLEADEIEKDFYEVLSFLDFLPNSPTLMNAGRELQQLSACFVLPVEDSMEGIFDAVKAAAIIHKAGGGTGFSFSRLRPANDFVGSTSGVASGPVSFMRVFDSATETVKQGSMRRGANMAVLSVHHPDIIEFITCKESGNQLNNFNISVAATNEFMEAVKEGGELNLINPRSLKIVKKIPAREVFDQIVYYAWKNGDPGIIFIDRMNEANPTPEAGKIESTNPCGEQPLLPFESCNLGSINLAHMVATHDHTKSVDWEKLKRTVTIAVHFLDNVIDVNRYTLPQIEQMTKANRKIGLGVMGWADMLVQLSLPYAEPRSLKLAEEIMETIEATAREESWRLGQFRGSFPNFSKSALTEDWSSMRNATVTTIAPTGSISLIAGCSSGIEPLFAVAFKSIRLDRTELLEVNPYFEVIAKEKGFYSDELMKNIVDSGTLKDQEKVPPAIKKVFSTAHDISPEDHIKMQAAFQKHTDNAVSKTINFSSTATVDDVAKAYMMAYETGCKGITIYRDMSRETQVLYKGTNKTDKQPTPKKRGDVTKGYTKKIPTGCGSLYVTLNEDEETETLFEVFARIGKAGGCASSQSEAVGRLASMALRAGMAVEEVIEQLRSISCHTPAWTPKGKVMSCADAISKALEWYLETKELEAKPKRKSEIHRGACPNCGGNLMYMEGCAKCVCGYSDCG